MVRRLALAISVFVIAVLLGAPTPRAKAAALRTFQQRWFDTCAAPSQAQMDAWLSSPYYAVGIYVGGNSRGCPVQPNLTPAWRTYVLTHGWGLMPIWAGPQLPCSGYVNRFSSTPSTASAQGSAEAVAASNAVLNLGFPTAVQVVYDIEGTSNTITASCITAVQSFVQGWTDALRANGRTDGYYGPACAPSLNNFATNPRPPAFVWGADWSGNSSTSSINCTQSYYWTSSQRHKQYSTSPHYETWGGVQLLIDTDCGNGPMYSLDWGVEPTCL